MKKQLLILSVSVLTMMSCENPMTFRTKVNEDGSLDKTIIFDKADKKIRSSNIFDISEKDGWSVKTEQTKDKEKYRIEFNKHFASDLDMNKELDKPTDTLFHVSSKFEKKFRWFFTYIRYSETFLPINRFKLLPAKDFFNREDSLFIQRLPGEGSKISKADSVYLEVLNYKISERFATMAIFNETFKALKDVISENVSDKKWLDSLIKNQELVYNLIEKDRGSQSIAQKVIDTLKIPMAKNVAEQKFTQRLKPLHSRIDFMSFAKDGKYVNEFEMPWNVIGSNADSVAGNKLYWKPMMHKFAYMDYEMYAESRKMNWWAVIVSVVILLVTVVALWKNSKTN